MELVELSAEQRQIIENPVEDFIFLEGPAGTGKTTAGFMRMAHLIDHGIKADQILVLVPQRALAAPYHHFLQSDKVYAGGQPSVLTLGGIARRMITLFWPLVSEIAGFVQSGEQPRFLTLETSQYYMARQVDRMLEKGYFDQITIQRNRLYSQILDNLNKSALVGFPLTEIGTRLKSAWNGDPAHTRIYDEVQECANLFRTACLDNNLLDYSLQIELFTKHVRELPEFQFYMHQQFDHLIADNLEEDTPTAHDFMADWLQELSSALLIYDTQAGYRRFLGADPISGYRFKERCPIQRSFQASFVASEELNSLGAHLAKSFSQSSDVDVGEISSALRFESFRYHTQMLDWVAQKITGIVQEEGAEPGDIVVISPFLSDALRFALTQRLEENGIPWHSHRPSRTLREEPASRSLLTLASLAHPQWGLIPNEYELTFALMNAIFGMDLIRARLVSRILYQTKDGIPKLLPVQILNPEMLSRITQELANRYEELRQWLEQNMGSPSEELDFFLSRLFGEVLSQPGFGFHANYEAGAVSANLIESIQKFRWVVGEELRGDIGEEYVRLVGDGLVASTYIRSWTESDPNSVLLSPAYTYLMSNRPVDYQFWIDVGGSGWGERLYQPLTHPHVLSRQWPENQLWTDADEHRLRQQNAFIISLGLLRRCRKGIFLGLSELGEQGYEQQGPLLLAFQRVFRNVSKPDRDKR